MSTSPAELRALVSRGEDQHTEFKGAVPHPGVIAQNIGALANASGGRLILGVTEAPKAEPAVRGVDAGRARRAIMHALDMLTPRPSVDIETVAIDGQDVVVVYIRPSVIRPVLARGVAYVRQGEINAAATANELLSRIRPDQGAEEMRRMLEQFGQAIEQQGKLIERLLADSGWRPKLVWTLVGGVVGALLGLIPTLLLG
ncbi:AlbA family DNA-binding domain-containing protein [Micromonospora haikouensis]|uniref:AlbA family DNA-binding domain-containing protein n=1 Tax=Micromonospora haikouensis TaxID=686309 RepID=UPI003D7570EB